MHYFLSVISAGSFILSEIGLPAHCLTLTIELEQTQQGHRWHRPMPRISRSAGGAGYPLQREDKDRWNAGSCVKAWGAGEGESRRTSEKFWALVLMHMWGIQKNGTDEPWGKEKRCWRREQACAGQRAGMNGGRTAAHVRCVCKTDALMRPAAQRSQLCALW